MVGGVKLEGLGDGFRGMVLRGTLELGNDSFLLFRSPER